MVKVIILVGASGSGKSTWTENEHRGSVGLLSRSLLHNPGGGKFPKSGEIARAATEAEENASEWWATVRLLPDLTKLPPERRGLG